MKNKLIFVLVFVIAVVALEAMVLTKKSEAKIYSSDIWNKDINWSYDTETKVLTISGNGEAPACNYIVGNRDEGSGAYYSPTDFELDKSEVKKVIIEEGITSIGEQAFGWADEWKSLDEVVLPSTLTNIGDDAFFDASSLKTIDIPDSVISIGSRAFQETGITEIKLPNNLKEIGPLAFYMCDGLTEVSIPKDTIDIGYSAFGKCANLKNIYVDDENSKYNSIDGVLMTKDGSTLEQYPSGKNDNTYYIPNGISTFDPYAFDGAQNLREIVFPGSITQILLYYSESETIESLVIPKEIGDIKHVDYVSNIYCQSESSAEEYAKTNNVPYVIDDDVPVINGVVQDGKFITINVQDEIVGLHRDAYSLDGVTWSSSNKLEIESEKEYTIYVRDKLGNIATIDFKADKFEDETEQKEESKTSETEGQSKDETSTTEGKSNNDETVAKEKLGSYGDKKVGIIIAVIGCFAIYKYRRFKSVQ